VTWTIRVVPEAEAEFEASARWYDEQAALRAKFVAAIDTALNAISDAPLRYPLWRSEASYRKYVVRQVPYIIYYRILRDYVQILAFAHTSRRPGYWLHR
jgi:plasmid stabilization system protein ParE